MGGGAQFPYVSIYHNGKPALQTGAAEFDKCEHLQEREGVQNAAKLHYGKCGMQQFWGLPHPLLETESEESAAFAVLILAFWILLI